MSITTQIQKAGSISELRSLMYRAETAEDQAAICKREAELIGNPFAQSTQLDLYGIGDTRADIELAFQAAACDAQELRWLSEAHLIAYGNGRQDECVKIIQRIRAIKGPAAPPCTRTHRFSRGRSYQRRAFAHGFTTW